MHSPLTILAAAFASDPLMTYIQPDPARRTRAVTWMSRRSLALARQSGVTDLVDGAGVGLWFPPSSDAFSAFSLARAGFLSAPLVMGPAATRRMSLSETDLETADRPSEAWYFFMLGVHPDAQGTGVARRLLEKGISRADASGAPTRLETNNERNVTLYERFGFTVTAHLNNLPNLEQWVMYRPAR